MEYKIHCVPSEPALGQGLEASVSDHVTTLERQLSKFSLRSLSIHAERFKKPLQFEIRVSLILDNQPLSITASSPFIESAVSLAFRKLARQVRIYKEQLRKTHTYERIRHLKESEPDAKEIDSLAAELESRIEKRDFLGFRDSLTDLLPRLERFVLQEIRFHEGGEKIPNRTDLARDIVEEALLHTYEIFLEKHPGLNPEKWIFRHALELIGSHLSNAQEELVETEWTRGQTPISSLENGREEEDRELLDELEGFPDELVDFESLSAPETNGEGSLRRDRQLSLSQAMGQLPVEERKVLLLCFSEGFRPVEAGAVLNCSEQRVRRLIDRGTQRLRSALRSSLLR